LPNSDKTNTVQPTAKNLKGELGLVMVRFLDALDVDIFSNDLTGVVLCEILHSVWIGVLPTSL